MTISQEAGATAVPASSGHSSSTGQATAAYAPTHRLGLDSDTSQPDVHVNVAGQRGDQVRWGPVWAGLIVALPTFLLGTLLFLALGVLDGDSTSGTTTGVVTGLIALGAFFLGGLTAAATTMWRDVRTGLLHGILVWALSIVAILGLTLLGGGALLGSAGNIASQLIDPAAVTSAASQVDGSDVPEVSASDQAAAVDAGQSAASYGVLGLGLTFLASAAGGVVGAKFWPRKKSTETTTTRASAS